MPNITITISDELLKDCAHALRYKAHNEAGLSQAPELFKAEDTLEWSQALQVEALLQHARQRAHSGHSLEGAPAFKERAAVLAFQQKFGVPMATEPSWLPGQLFRFRLEFLKEELLEFEVACLRDDMHGAADALVDLAYVLHGTALMMGLPWPMLWEEVQRANMAKVRAKCANESKRGSSFDVIKPAGWKGPDHTAALGKGPWPVLKLEDES